ncbi:hypothetical protein TNCV_4920011 [Trichonephila clavipes]|nr:hypothetical protein TNCV_4920011 [Trichonephila clavipes]
MSNLLPQKKRKLARDVGTNGEKRLVNLATRLRKTTADQSSRVPSHHTTLVTSSKANCIIGSVQAKKAPSLRVTVFPNHLKGINGRTSGVTAPLCGLRMTPTHQCIHLEWCHARRD